MKHLVLSAFCLAALGSFCAGETGFPSSAYAAPSDTAVSSQQQIFKGQLEGFLDAQKESAKRNGCTLSSSGEITVESAKDYYAFTLPNLVYTDALGIRSNLGMLAINAVPEAGGIWGVSLAFPTPVLSYNKDGMTIFRTDIGTQAGHGLWHERLGQFVALDYKMENVKFTDFVQKRSLSIATASIFSLLKEQDDGIFTGKGKVTVKDVVFTSISADGAPMSLTLPRIVFESPLSGRAANDALNRDDMKTRFSKETPSFPDGMNLVAQILGKPDSITATITGLDTTAATLQKTMPLASKAEQEDYMRAFLGLKTLEAIGLSVEGDPMSRRYEIVMTPDGRFLVNGMDFSVIFAGNALLSGAASLPH